MAKSGYFTNTQNLAMKAGGVIGGAACSARKSVNSEKKYKMSSVIRDSYIPSMSTDRVMEHFNDGHEKGGAHYTFNNDKSGPKMLSDVYAASCIHETDFQEYFIGKCVIDSINEAADIDIDVNDLHDRIGMFVAIVEDLILLNCGSARSIDKILKDLQLFTRKNREGFTSISSSLPVCIIPSSPSSLTITIKASDQQSHAYDAEFKFSDPDLKSKTYNLEDIIYVMGSIVHYLEMV